MTHSCRCARVAAVLPPRTLFPTRRQRPNSISEQGIVMWAQLITARLEPEKEADLPKLFEQVQAAEQRGEGTC